MDRIERIRNRMIARRSKNYKDYCRRGGTGTLAEYRGICLQNANRAKKRVAHIKECLRN